MFCIVSLSFIEILQHENIISTCNSDARFLKFTLNIKTYKKFEEFIFKLVLRESLLKNNLYSMKKKKLELLTIDTLSSIYFVNMNNTRDTNYFTKKLINCWYDDWLLINEKVILMIGLNKISKRLVTLIFYKNIIK